MKSKICMVAILTWGDAGVVGYSTKNPKWRTVKFKTTYPAHETGLVDLVAQITNCCWKRGIHQFDNITFLRKEPLR